MPQDQDQRRDATVEEERVERCLQTRNGFFTEFLCDIFSGGTAGVARCHGVPHSAASLFACLAGLISWQPEVFSDQKVALWNLIRLDEQVHTGLDSGGTWSVFPTLQELDQLIKSFEQQLVDLEVSITGEDLDWDLQGACRQRLLPIQILEDSAALPGAALVLGPACLSNLACLEQDVHREQEHRFQCVGPWTAARPWQSASTSLRGFSYADTLEPQDGIQSLPTACLGFPEPCRRRCHGPHGPQRSRAGSHGRTGSLGPARRPASPPSTRRA